MYTNQSIQFCRVDVEFLGKLAKKYSINTDSTSRQLPTLLVIENGKETGRFPPVPKAGKPIGPISYNERNVVRYLEIDSKFYMTSANKPSSSK